MEQIYPLWYSWTYVKPYKPQNHMTSTGYCRIFWPWSSKGVIYANFISDLLSVVFAQYTEQSRLFEMECLI